MKQSKALARLNSATVNAVLKGTYQGGERRLPDGGGLYLVPGPNGGGSWILRYQRAGKATESGLGSLAQVGAAEARAMRAKMVASKAPAVVHRAARKVAAGQMTFRDAAEPVIAHYETGPFHPTTGVWWRSISERLLFPKLGHLTVDEIGRAEVLDIVRPLWPSAAGERARAIIEAVVEEAKSMGHSDENRANPALKKSIKANLKRFAPTHAGKRNHPSLPWAEVPALMARLFTPRSDRYHKNSRPGVSALALMFTILSGVRAGEATGARWTEIKGDTWHIPAERMKGKQGQRKPHDVPISAGMRMVLDTLRPNRGTSPFVFPSYASGKSITPGAMLAMLRDFGLNDRTNVHGLRASFRTFAQERGFADGPSEAALAHYKTGVEGRYARSPFFAERVPLMKAWSDHCLGALAKQRHLSIAG